MSRPEVSLADLMLAIERLGARRQDEQRRIAALFGLTRFPAAEDDDRPARTPAVVESVAGPPAQRREMQRPTTPKRSRVLGLSEVGDQPLARSRPNRIEQLAEAGRSTPPRRLRPLAELVGESEGVTLDKSTQSAALAIEPSLFTSHWRRALLSTALSIPTRDGPIDADAVVRRVAAGLALTELPRLLLPTMRHGVQLLIDSRAGMRPYAADQERMRRHVAQVAGRDGLRVAWFSGCPARGIEPEERRAADIVDDLDWEPEAYQPPLRQAPVLLLSDLGIGAVGRCPDRADEQEWLQFACRVRDNGNRLLAFVPFPPRRWPPRLRRLMTLIEWDRATSVGDIRRVLAAIGS